MIGPNVMAQLEPEASSDTGADPVIPLVSIAISLKRIADAMAAQDHGNAIVLLRDAITDGIANGFGQAGRR